MLNNFVEMQVKGVNICEKVFYRRENLNGNSM